MGYITEFHLWNASHNLWNVILTGKEAEDGNPADIVFADMMYGEPRDWVLERVQASNANMYPDIELTAFYHPTKRREMVLSVRHLPIKPKRTRLWQFQPTMRLVYRAGIKENWYLSSVQADQFVHSSVSHADIKDALEKMTVNAKLFWQEP